MKKILLTRLAFVALYLPYWFYELLKSQTHRRRADEQGDSNNAMDFLWGKEKNNG